jgi:hypothetical protein
MIRRNGSVSAGFAILGAVAAVAGCGGKTTQSVDTVLRESGQSREAVFPLAGTITIDGQAPETGFGKPQLIVLLFDQAKPEVPADSVPKAFCDAKGEFAFSTYGERDGVAAGKYVLALLKLKFNKKKGYFGNDLLKNLYNDPSQNLTVPELTIDHQSPGKKDYAIDLKIAGRDAVTPGPKAVTKMK